MIDKQLDYFAKKATKNPEDRKHDEDIKTVIEVGIPNPQDPSFLMLTISQILHVSLVF